MQLIDRPLNRPNLSDDLANSLRDMIVDGRLAAGQRINEVHLAASLGVSRTPLREALAALVAEGALTSVPRRGVFVRELTVSEAESIYPMRALLDPEALRLAGIPSPERLERLESINDELRSAADVEVAIQLDDAWHAELWADCPNPVLTDLIRQFMQRTKRYELASMRDRDIVLKSTESKAAIIDALRAQDLDRACATLRESLTTGVRPVVEWLTQRRIGK
jgi:DNA-binding GntR family transcriptional regulator